MRLRSGDGWNLAAMGAVVALMAAVASAVTIVVFSRSYSGNRGEAAVMLAWAIAGISWFVWSLQCEVRGLRPVLMINTAWLSVATLIEISSPGLSFWSVILAAFWFGLGITWLISLIRAFDERAQPDTKPPYLRLFTPVLCVLLMAGAEISDLPFQARFDISRQQLNELADTVAAQPDRRLRAPGCVRYLCYTSASANKRGEVTIFLSGGFMESQGLVRTAGGSPDDVSADADLGGNWYFWVEGF